MKSLTDKEIENRDYRDAMEILIDGESKFSVHDGEPEDNSLGRNFNDCWKIADLLKMAFEAGKNGEEFHAESKQVDEF